MKYLLLCCIACLCCFGFAQEEETETETNFIDDPTDISAYLEQFSEGIPTVADVEGIKQRATAAFEGGNCEAAIPLLEAMVTQTNTLANTFRQTLEPFYGGGYDEREEFSISSIEELLDNESQSNDYIFDRNSAWVMLGECELKNGNEDRAIGYFYEALDRMSLETTELSNWKRAAQGVMQIIEAPNASQ